MNAKSLRAALSRVPSNAQTTHLSPACAQRWKHSKNMPYESSIAPRAPRTSSRREGRGSRSAGSRPRRTTPPSTSRRLRRHAAARGARRRHVTRALAERRLQARREGRIATDPATAPNRVSPRRRSPLGQQVRRRRGVLRPPGVAAAVAGAARARGPDRLPLAGRHPTPSSRTPRPGRPAPPAPAPRAPRRPRRARGASATTTRPAVAVAAARATAAARDTGAPPRPPPPAAREVAVAEAAEAERRDAAADARHRRGGGHVQPGRFQAGNPPGAGGEPAARDAHKGAPDAPELEPRVGAAVPELPARRARRRGDGERRVGAREGARRRPRRRVPGVRPRAARTRCPVSSAPSSSHFYDAGPARGLRTHRLLSQKLDDELEGAALDWLDETKRRCEAPPCRAAPSSRRRGRADQRRPAKQDERTGREQDQGLQARWHVRRAGP